MTVNNASNWVYFAAFDQANNDKQIMKDINWEDLGANLNRLSTRQLRLVIELIRHLSRLNRDNLAKVGACKY